MSRREDELAYTLYEIMIVVLVVGVLIAIAVPNFVRATRHDGPTPTARATDVSRWGDDYCLVLRGEAAYERLINIDESTVHAVGAGSGRAQRVTVAADGRVYRRYQGGSAELLGQLRGVDHDPWYRVTELHFYASR